MVSSVMKHVPCLVTLSCPCGLRGFCTDCPKIVHHTDRAGAHFESLAISSLLGNSDKTVNTFRSSLHMKRSICLLDMPSFRKLTRIRAFLMGDDQKSSI
jgi:hypothetical protein